MNKSVIIEPTTNENGVTTAYLSVDYVLDDKTDIRDGVIAVISDQGVGVGEAVRCYYREVMHCTNAIQVDNIRPVIVCSTKKVIGAVFISGMGITRTVTFSNNPISRSFVDGSVGNAKSVQDAYRLLSVEGSGLDVTGRESRVAYAMS